MKAQVQNSNEGFAQARMNMIECQVKPGGVRDAAVCRAMGAIPREIFATPSQRDIAYADCAVDMVGDTHGRQMAMPHSFGLMVESAQIQRQDVILDIAGGSGYAAAVLSQLGATVLALECDDEFSQKCTEIWSSLAIDNCVSVTGPLAEGLSKQAPFDVIFINGFIEQIPDALLAQLAPEGRLVCVSPHDGAAQLTIIRRVEDVFARRYGPVISVPRLHAFDRVPEFSF